MTQLTGKIFAIPMPKGAESCEIRGAHPGRPYPLLSFYGEGEAVELPAGEYQIVVFNTKTATEEDARKVVESCRLALDTRIITAIIRFGIIPVKNPYPPSFTRKGLIRIKTIMR